MLKKFAFISRHVPTPKQHELAKEKGIELVHVGDVDGFHGDLMKGFPKWEGPTVWKIGSTTEVAYREWWNEKKFHGAIVVHAAAALRLVGEVSTVGVFENANRAKEGERPTFEPVALHLWADFSCLDGALSANIRRVPRVHALFEETF